MRLWRICKQRHTATAFSGEGARRVAGRWHHKGTPVVYTSMTLALAALETFVHVEADDLPDDLVAIPADLPDRLARRRIDPATLPDGWRSWPGPDALRDIGTGWVQAGTSVALRVPSAIIDEPEEENVLLNPMHADFASLTIGARRPFVFDGRMRR